MHCTQLLAVRWREPEPEVIAVDTPGHPTTPIARGSSFSLKNGHSSSANVSSSSAGQLQQEEEEKEKEEKEVREEEVEGEREEEKEGSQEEPPPSPPTPIATPQLLIKALTTSLKKVC